MPHQPENSELRSMNTVLTDSLLFVCMTSTAEVPPFVMFKDVGVLHSRLVASGVLYMSSMCARRMNEMVTREARRDEASQLILNPWRSLI